MSVIGGDYYLENLYRYEGAGTSINSATNPSANLNGGAVATSHVNLSEVGLVAGNVISVSAVIQNVTSGDNVRLELRFQTAVDGGGSTISTVTGTYANLTSLTRVTIENVTIPATTLSMHMFVRRQNGTGTIRAHKGMINRGPTAAPYARPFRGHTYTNFPLWTNGFSRARVQPVNIDSIFKPLGQAPITQDYNSGLSDYWTINLTTLPTEGRDMRRFIAWCNLVGLHGKVAVRDPMQLDPGEDERVPLLNGAVNGAGQSGSSSVISDGWPASTLIFSAGDYLEIAQRFYQSTQDVSTDGSGNATFTLWPKLVSVSDNDIIHINRPHLHTLLLNMPETDYYLAMLAQQQSLAFRENK